MTIFQKPRKLYTIRNVGGHATRKAVMAAEPLELSLPASVLDIIVPEFRVENTHLPSYANTKLHDTLHNTLPSILLGTEPRWKLWESEIHTDRIVLHYVDRENTATSKTKNTDLSCFMFWRKGVNLQISAPPSSGVFPNFFRIWFTMTQEDEGYLSITYPSDLTTADGRNLLNDETYGIHPERG